MNIFDSIFGKMNEKTSLPEKPAGAGAVYLTRQVVYGSGDSSVYFVDENRGIRKMLVDESGVICSFPGIVKESFWTDRMKCRLDSRIRYRTDFVRCGDSWRILWQVQPDGRYWADSDGFGIEDDEEIFLYTGVDADGNYTGPFRLYSINGKMYAE